MPTGSTGAHAKIHPEGPTSWRVHLVGRLAWCRWPASTFESVLRRGFLLRQWLPNIIVTQLHAHALPYDFHDPIARRASPTGTSAGPCRPALSALAVHNSLICVLSWATLLQAQTGDTIGRPWDGASRAPKDMHASSKSPWQNAGIRGGARAQHMAGVGLAKLGLGREPLSSTSTESPNHDFDASAKHGEGRT